jgi:hypothetical protein
MTLSPIDHPAQFSGLGAGGGEAPNGDRADR